MLAVPGFLGATMMLSGMVLLLGLAQANPPQSGGFQLFESYSPVTQDFYGPVTPGQDPRVSSWYQVSTQGDTTTVVVLPERRIRWVITSQDGRPVSKDVFVRDKLYSRCRNEYDQAGQRIAKEVMLVTESGQSKTMRYERNADGTLQAVRPEGGGQTWIISHPKAVGSVWALRDAEGKLLRRDVYDPHGWLLRSEFSEKPAAIALDYSLDREGRITGVTRTLHGKAQPAHLPNAPIPDLSDRELAAHPQRNDMLSLLPLMALMNSSMTRREVHLVLGVAARGRYRIEGEHETVEEFYGCVLNEPTVVHYSPLEWVAGVDAECICGFCIGGEAPVRTGGDGEIPLREMVPGRTLEVFDPQKQSFSSTTVQELWWHWANEIVVIDGSLRLTGNHRLLTPDGEMPAGKLTAGSKVIGRNGEVRVIQSVERQKLKKPERLFSIVPAGTPWWHSVGGFIVGEDRE